MLCFCSKRELLYTPYICLCMVAISMILIIYVYFHMSITLHPRIFCRCPFKSVKKVPSKTSSPINFSRRLPVNPWAICFWGSPGCAGRPAMPATNRELRAERCGGTSQDAAGVQTQAQGKWVTQLAFAEEYVLFSPVGFTGNR